MDFTVPAPVPPAAATLVSPNGSTTSNPTYTWNISPDTATEDPATWYYLYVSGPSNYVFTQWYRALDFCGASTCTVANATPNLAIGQYRWWVQTWNGTGYGPWSTGMDFTVPAPVPPAAATLVSPNGSITTINPTYTWNKVSGATWYYLYVSGPSNYVFAQWYHTDAVCGVSTCSVANATPNLAVGTHRWWVQTWSGAGYGPWSTGMDFTPTPPAATTLVSPNGSTTSNPTYTWNKVSGATWYYIYVSGPSNYVFAQWYHTDAVCGASTCSVPSATPGLASGQYRWWIQTWNNAGYGPWSTGVNFSVP
jgi:L-rhamnose mutarotase